MKLLHRGPKPPRTIPCIIKTDVSQPLLLGLLSKVPWINWLHLCSWLYYCYFKTFSNTEFIIKWFHIFNCQEKYIYIKSFEINNGKKPSEGDFSEGLNTVFDFVETVLYTQSVYREILYLIQPESEDLCFIFVKSVLQTQSIYRKILYLIQSESEDLSFIFIKSAGNLTSILLLLISQDSQK